MRRGIRSIRYTRAFIEAVLNHLSFKVWAQSDFRIDRRAEYDVIIQYPSGGMYPARMPGTKLDGTIWARQKTYAACGVLPCMGYRVAIKTRVEVPGALIGPWTNSPRMARAWVFVRTPPEVQIAKDSPWNWQERMR